MLQVSTRIATRTLRAASCTRNRPLLGLSAIQRQTHHFTTGTVRYIGANPNHAPISKPFHALGWTQANVYDVLRLSSELKSAQAPQMPVGSASESDIERSADLVQSMRRGGHALDDVVNDIVKSHGQDVGGQLPESFIVAIESALFADKMLGACTDGAQVLSQTDRHRLNNFVHKLREGEGRSLFKTRKPDEHLKTLVDVLRDPEACTKDLHRLRMEVPRLAALLAAEQSSQTLNVQAKNDAREQVKCLEKRLEQEVELRNSYGTTETEILVAARPSRLLWAMFKKGSWGMVNTVGDIVRWVVVCVCVIPFVVAFASVPFWVAIMIIGTMAPASSVSDVPLAPEVMEDDEKVFKERLWYGEEEGAPLDQPEKLGGKTLACLAVVLCMVVSVIPVGRGIGL